MIWPVQSSVFTQEKWKANVGSSFVYNNLKQETTEMFVKIRSPSVRTTDTAFSNIYGSQNR